MKKQTKHSIKAHLLWSALILLALLAVCAIPFTLAQSRSRGTSKQSVATPAAKTNAPANMYNPQVANRADGAVSDQPLPNISQTGQSQLSNEATSGPSGVQATGILPGPKAPQVVLYDQYDNDLGNGIVSANRTDNSSLSAEAADNFVVPGGQTWTVTEVDIRSPAGFPAPTSFAVNFYLDNGSGFPGTQVYTSSGLAVTGNPDYIITLTVPAVLISGTYWVSAVGTISGSNWFWEGRSVTSNTFSTAWRNPGNGYGTGCTDWGRLTTCIGINWPDQMFRIVGTSGGGLTPTPTPTPTGTPCPNAQYTITQIGGSIVPGTTDIGNHGDDTVTTIALPFAFTLYDQSFTSINLSSNGNAQFVTTDTAFTNVCLPWTTHNYTIFPYWADLFVVNSGFGIFTSVSGTAPNRIFNIEWRAQDFPGSGTANFEMRLYEGQTRFDLIYGTVTNGN